MRNTAHKIRPCTSKLMSISFLKLSGFVKLNAMYFTIINPNFCILQSEEQVTLKAYAELWGTDATGYQLVPVAWMQAMTDVKQTTKGLF